jgi:signal transduction histidine kinase
VRESDDRLSDLRASFAEAEAARQEADRANRAKSQFLANMSHELRTPMNAVIGYTEIMLSGMAGAFTDKQMELLTNIQVNARRLLNLINDVLDLAKVEAGRMQVVAAMGSPREMVIEVVNGMTSLAEKNGIYLRVQFADDTPQAVLTDIRKVQQIVTNLVGNAIKFTEKGGVTVEVGSATNVSDWQIKVRDTGIGMPADAKDYIFEKFRQVDGTEARAYQGSGLGLAIVQSLAETLHGSVDLETKLGEGTTFTVTLPRQYADKAEVA